MFISDIMVGKGCNKNNLSKSVTDCSLTPPDHDTHMPCSVNWFQGSYVIRFRSFFLHALPFILCRLPTKSQYVFLRCLIFIWKKPRETQLFCINVQRDIQYYLTRNKIDSLQVQTSVHISIIFSPPFPQGVVPDILTENPSLKPGPLMNLTNLSTVA